MTKLNAQGLIPMNSRKAPSTSSPTLSAAAQEQLAAEAWAEAWAQVEGESLPPLWKPFAEKPQEQAYYCPADELFFGGAAGAGKTDLGIGLAITAHRKSIFFRRQLPELRDVIERSKEILDGVAKLNENLHIWRSIPGGRTLEFGYVKDDKALRSYKGRPHDLKVFDEVSDFTEKQYTFLTGWARTNVKGQRVRIVAMGNPPTSAEGEWVIRRWGAWLDPQHPNPAKAGELRWYARVDDKEVERPDGQPFEHKGEQIRPKSRTFIPGRVTDNPVYMATDYPSQLQNLPEPLRSQLLFGDFQAGVKDGAYQVIPTEWVRLAQQRWREGQRPAVAMRALGVDVARGGDDKTVLAPLYHTWFDPLQKYPGKSTPDGPAVAQAVLAYVPSSSTPVYVDGIGVGASVYDTLRLQGHRAAHSIIFSEGTEYTDSTGRLKMTNVRAAAYWALREALDPKSGMDLALPDDPELLADLCAPKWGISKGGVLIESKEDIVKRLGRSPDCADAVALAWWGERSSGPILAFASHSAPKRSAPQTPEAEEKRAAEMTAAFYNRWLKDED